MIAAAISGKYIYDYLKNDEEYDKQDRQIKKIVESPDPKQPEEKKNVFTFTKDTWQQLHQQNQDFLAYLHFDDDSISLPVVQTSDDAYYLKHGFNKQYLSMGTAFFDSAAKVSDTNLVMYAHSVDYSPSKMLTPLMNYTKQEGYDSCHKFSLYFENEVREYETAYVYFVDSSEAGEYDYVQPNFVTEETFNKWNTFPKQHNLITPITQIGYGDKFVTLQTCKPYTQGSIKLVVVGKEVNRKSY